MDHDQCRHRGALTDDMLSLPPGISRTLRIMRGRNGTDTHNTYRRVGLNSDFSGSSHRPLMPEDLFRCPLSPKFS